MEFLRTLGTLIALSQVQSILADCPSADDTTRGAWVGVSDDLAAMADRFGLFQDDLYVGLKALDMASACREHTPLLVMTLMHPEG